MTEKRVMWLLYLAIALILGGMIVAVSQVETVDPQQPVKSVEGADLYWTISAERFMFEGHEYIRFREGGIEDSTHIIHAPNCHCLTGENK